MTEKFGADLIVDSLINHKVDYVFGIPGAKIDRVFDTLEDKGPQLIVARHEQNAAFMARNWADYRRAGCRDCNEWTRCFKLSNGLGYGDRRGRPSAGFGWSGQTL